MSTDEPIRVSRLVTVTSAVGEAWLHRQGKHPDVDRLRVLEVVHPPVLRPEPVHDRGTASSTARWRPAAHSPTRPAENAPGPAAARSGFPPAAICLPYRYREKWLFSPASSRPRS